MSDIYLKYDDRPGGPKNLTVDDRQAADAGSSHSSIAGWMQGPEDAPIDTTGSQKPSETAAGLESVHPRQSFEGGTDRNLPLRRTTLHCKGGPNG